MKLTNKHLIVSFQIPHIKVFHFKHPKACSGQHRCKRHAKDLVQLLMKEPHVSCLTLGCVTRCHAADDSQCDVIGRLCTTN